MNCPYFLITMSFCPYQHLEHLTDTKTILRTKLGKICIHFKFEQTLTKKIILKVSQCMNKIIITQSRGQNYKLKEQGQNRNWSFNRGKNTIVPLFMIAQGFIDAVAAVLHIHTTSYYLSCSSANCAVDRNLYVRNFWCFVVGFFYYTYTVNNRARVLIIFVKQLSSYILVDVIN